MVLKTISPGCGVRASLMLPLLVQQTTRCICWKSFVPMSVIGIKDNHNTSHQGWVSVAISRSPLVSGYILKIPSAGTEPMNTKLKAK